MRSSAALAASSSMLRFHSSRIPLTSPTSWRPALSQLWRCARASVPRARLFARHLFARDSPSRVTSHARTSQGKVVSGPVCTALGAKVIGLIALAGSAILLIGVGLGGASPLLPLTLAWPAFRAVQTITWPSANSVCVAWFDRSEHGGAWGVMSTASRCGIIAAT